MPAAGFRLQTLGNHLPVWYETVEWLAIRPSAGGKPYAPRVGIARREIRREPMHEPQAFLSQPGVGFFAMLLIGALAGWIAERVTRSDHGILTNIIVGIAGAFVGGKLAEVAQVSVFGFFRTLFSATTGAILILWFWRVLRARR